MSPSTRDSGPGGLVSCASCQLCPFPPGCLFPALGQRLAGGLPKLRRRRQVSGDTGGHRAGDRGHRAGVRDAGSCLASSWPSLTAVVPVRPPCASAAGWFLGAGDAFAGCCSCAGLGTPWGPPPPPPQHPGQPQEGPSSPSAGSGSGSAVGSRAGSPSPAHGPQRDQVHRAGGGERPPAGKRGVGGPGDDAVGRGDQGAPQPNLASCAYPPPVPAAPQVRGSHQQLRQVRGQPGRHGETGWPWGGLALAGTGSGGGWPRGCCPWGWPWTLGGSFPGRWSPLGLSLEGGGCPQCWGRG